MCTGRNWGKTGQWFFQNRGDADRAMQHEDDRGDPHGYADNLILRAADVTVKEQRTLVLAARETPLSGIHLRNLYELSMPEVRIIPPMLTFYHKPESIDDMVYHIAAKLLNRLGSKQRSIADGNDYKRVCGDLQAVSWRSVLHLSERMLICLKGGERPHLGCVVQTEPRVSLTGDGSVSATSSVLNFPGHKDEVICRWMSEKVSKELGKRVVCTGGFHIRMVFRRRRSGRCRKCCASDGEGDRRIAAVVE